MARNENFKDIDVIVISGEDKAYQTAEHLIQHLQSQGRKIEVIRESKINELGRDRGGFLDKEKYEEVAKRSLSNPEESINGWEPAARARERFTNGVEEIDQRFEGKKIAFVGHGYTMNMYFAQKMGELERVYERLHTNDFCDWGVVRDGKVVKDLGPDLGRVGERLV